MNYSDAHAHLNDMRTDQMLQLIAETDLIFTCSSSEDNWTLTEDIASNDDHIIPFFGTHPWYADTYNGTEKLTATLSRNRKAGIGEIGLDLKKENPNEQYAVFLEQLSLAEQLQRPVTIHMIAAEEIILKSLRKFKVTAILHSFSGPQSYIKPFNECGCYFSISPRILNKSPDRIRTIVESIPLDRLLIESDAPNNKASVKELVMILSQILHMSEEELISATSDNLHRILP